MCRRVIFSVSIFFFFFALSHATHVTARGGDVRATHMAVRDDVRVTHATRPCTVMYARGAAAPPPGVFFFHKASVCLLLGAAGIVKALLILLYYYLTGGSFAALSLADLFFWYTVGETVTLARTPKTIDDAGSKKGFCRITLATEVDASFDFVWCFEHPLIGT